jgi:hypothetical protein
MVKFRVQENLERAEAKTKKKKKIIEGIIRPSDIPPDYL